MNFLLKNLYINFLTKNIFFSWLRGFSTHTKKKILTMFFNNISKARNISLSNSQSYDLSYDNSLDNSSIENLDLYNFNNSLTIKNQIEKNIGKFF